MGGEKQHTILLVEDDLELAELISDRLKKEEYQVHHVDNGVDACLQIIDIQPDLVILDVMLPGLDGFSVCRKVRQDFKGTILILTARDDDLDQILGLDLGADDFVTKPIRPQVLMARIRALLRRTTLVEGNCTSESIRLGSLTVDCLRREAVLGEKPLPLTTIEYDLLQFLAGKAGQVVSRNDIHQALYNSDYDGLDRSIDVYISRLRQKLGDDPTAPRYLKTVRGVGYLLIGDGE